MQSHYPERFDREMGCTEAEWQRAVPAAMGDCVWTQDTQTISAVVGSGRLHIAWQVGAPRVIALMRMPRLQVSFDFQGVDETTRHAFMKRFDLYMQRGGG